MDDRDLDDGRPDEPLPGTSGPPLSRRAAKRAAREARATPGAVASSDSSGADPEAESPSFFSAAGAHVEVAASSPEAFLEDSTAADQARLRGLPPAGGPLPEAPPSLDAPAGGRLENDAAVPPAAAIKLDVPRLTPVPPPAPRAPDAPPAARGPATVPPPRDFRDGDRRLGRDAAATPATPPAPVSDPARAATPSPKGPDPAARQPADPELLPPRSQGGGASGGGDYAPPPPIRKRRLSATARFYLGFWAAVVLVVALTAAVGYKLGASAGEARGSAAATRSLALEAQCLREVKLAPMPPADRFTPPAYARDVYALAQANRCARLHGLPYLSAADLEELSGVKTDPASNDLAPPADPRWLSPEAAPPRAGAATGTSVRSGAYGR